jgi:penicillin-binding protein 2
MSTREILATATEPRPTPTGLASRLRASRQCSSIRQPLFDRGQMAIPCRSSPLTARLWSNGVIDPRSRFECRGYLDDRERLRCQLFRQQGIGHGDITLPDALAQSCNVYFFHHVREIGGVRMVDWAARLRQPAAIDRPDAAAGQLPAAVCGETASAVVCDRAGGSPPRPRMSRMYAAIANGGFL